ncbi:major facilitator superfamily domain-containing protein [Schizophyllum fasciatum]
MSGPGAYDDTKSLSASEKKDDHHVEVSVAQVDTAAALVAGQEHPLEPKEAARIRKKIDWHILPLMMILYWVQFMDKTTLGNSAILGIREDAHLSTSQYNWYALITPRSRDLLIGSANFAITRLGTIFYLSYLVFEFPQNLCLQRYPVGKWMSINIFVWAVAICCHAACTNFAGLFVVRILLGMCEGSITAGFMIVTSMFYTREEQTLRVGYWFLMNGTAQIISGFIAFGSLHIQTRGFAPWQWLMIITGIITLLTAAAFWFMFPDSPTSAWFLTPQERANAVLRIKENQTGVENKQFKMEQLVEALLDPKTWLFALLAALNNIPNSLTNQRSIIVSSFGFTTLQTTLLGCVDGLVEIVTIWTGVTIAAKIPNSRAYVGSIYLLPNILGVFLINFLPWDNKIGLLFSVWITGVGTTEFVLVLSWIGAVTSGHTKRVTTNAIVLCAYCIGNAAGPFMWQEKYKPRNHIPWIIIGICYACCIGLMLSVRVLLSRENKRRDQEPLDTTYDDIYIERVVDGQVMQVKVEKEFLDLTDKQNREYRYVL